MVNINYSFDISSAKKRLDKYCILIIDEKHAKCLKIKNSKIEELDMVTTLPIYEDQAGYFKGSTGGGISDEQNVRKEYQKRFYKEVLEKIDKNIQKFDLKKFIIMCPEEDISMITKILKNSLNEKLAGFVSGNYIKVGINEVLERAVEYA